VPKGPLGLVQGKVFSGEIFFYFLSYLTGWSVLICLTGLEEKNLLYMVNWLPYIEILTKMKKKKYSFDPSSKLKLSLRSGKSNMHLTIMTY
jgi:hypothetical protein